MIILSTGPITRTIHNFHYHQLCSLVETGTEPDIQPYLNPPKCPYGVYHLYTQGDHIYLDHIHRGNSTQLKYDSGKWHGNTFDTDKATYLGPHASLEAVYDTHPELFI